MTCLAKRHFRFSLVFFDHWPAFTAQKAFQSSANVEIDSPCFASLPVCSAIYSARSFSASCFGFVAGPRVFSFLRRADPDFSLAGALDFLNPALRRFDSGQAWSDALDLELDRPDEGGTFVLRSGTDFG